MHKSELARMAGVSRSTFSRFIAAHQAQLTEMGITPKTKLLPPRAVRFLAEAYCIDLSELE